MPTDAEWETADGYNAGAATSSGSTVGWDNSREAYDSTLKLTRVGNRKNDDGTLLNQGFNAHYWSSTVAVSMNSAREFKSDGSGANTDNMARANGLAVRCIKDGASTAPGAPGIGTATAGNEQATVAYTAPAYNGGSVITGYTATAIPGGISGSLSQAGSGTITVSGLTNGTGYTFTVTATNAINTGAASAASNSVAPVIPSVTSTNGRIWMDRNLGATQVATSSTDAASYGDLYQWGRDNDGHQSRASCKTGTAVTSASAGHGDFILTGSGTDYNWTNYGNENDLWQSGLNDPCPAGYGIPTEPELNLELTQWSGPNYAIDAYNSALKLPLAGHRLSSDGKLTNVGSHGYYWSSSVSSKNARYLHFGNGAAYMYNYNRAYGLSVRCIKDL